MLAALTLALQKFNIQARRGAPGFPEQKPRPPRKKPQSGRKLPKRLRYGHDSDRSRPTSPESGSFYTPASTPTFSPFTTPPQSPKFDRKEIIPEVLNDDFDSGIDGLVECKPVQSSAYISLKQPQYVNGYSSGQANHLKNQGLNDTAVKANLQNEIVPSAFPASKEQISNEKQVIQEDAIVVEDNIDVSQAPPVHDLINRFSQPNETNPTSTLLPANGNKKSVVNSKSNVSSQPKQIPVEEAPIDVIQVDRLAQAAPLPPSGVLGQQQQQQQLQQQRLQQNQSPTSPVTPMSPVTPVTPQYPFPLPTKPPQFDASILSAFNRVQDYFNKHPEHKSLTHEQLVNEFAKKSEADKDKAILDQLTKDHQYLLRRFIEQQDSSDDESFADERLKDAKKKKVPTATLR